MSRIPSAVFIVMIAAARVGAQTTDHPFNELARYLASDDTVHVVTHSSGEVSGRDATVAGNALTMTVGARSFQIPSSEIAWIEKRGDQLWNGALAGAGISSVLFAGAAAASCSDCGSEMTAASLVGAGFGAGLGAVIDWIHQGRTLIYGTRPPSVHSARSNPPVDRVAQLWSRIRPGDTISVRSADGHTIKGTFVRGSDSAVVVAVDGQQLQIESNGIESVVRHGSQLGRGVLIGPAVGALTTTMSALSSGSSGGEAAFAAAIGGISGLAWGTVIGRILPRHVSVYQTPSRTIGVAPILAPGQRGALFSVRY